MVGSGALSILGLCSECGVSRVKYRVIEGMSTPRTWKIQRKIARYWVTIAGFRDLDCAGARCAAISMDDAGWVKSFVLSAFSGAREAGQSWLRAAAGATYPISTIVPQGMTRALAAARSDALVLFLGALALWAMRSI